MSHTKVHGVHRVHRERSAHRVYRVCRVHWDPKVDRVCGGVNSVTREGQSATGGCMHYTSCKVCRQVRVGCAWGDQEGGVQSKHAANKESHGNADKAADCRCLSAVQTTEFRKAQTVAADLRSCLMPTRRGLV